jgi:Family of unknown function (DUF6226)
VRRHDDGVILESELLAAVDRAFSTTARGLQQWPDPHPDRSPRDEEYSRLTDPAKWRVIGARADAWTVALVDAGLAVVEADAAVDWREGPRVEISRAIRVVPFAPGALPLVIARSRIGIIPDAGVVLGVGDPAVCVQWFPDCGCDACDSGSQNELDHLDAHIRGIVGGVFRRLTDGEREITVIGEPGWTASGEFARREVDAILADPTGWAELTGESWLSFSSR